jgi:hypothetical protein
MVNSILPYLGAGKVEPPSAEAVPICSPGYNGTDLDITYVPAAQIVRAFDGGGTSPERQITLKCYQQIIVSVSNGAIYRSNGERISESFYMLGADESVPLDRSFVEFSDSDVDYIVCFNAGWRNYYHWTIQCAFSAFLFNRIHLARPHFIFPRVGRNAQALLECVGCQPDQTTFLAKDSIANISRAWTSNAAYRDFVYTPSALLADFSSAVTSSLLKLYKPSPQKIYISRRDSSNRVMQNEADVEKWMEQHGFQVFRLSGLSLEDQVLLFHSASTIVAPHGAGLTNIVYCKPGTTVHELVSEGYTNPCFARIGQMMMLRYNVHVFAGLTASSHRERVWNVDLKYLSNLLTGG